ncbi:hypothetical protein N657DRAFT_693505 [Parathielavia appendiculata]|uniref:Uncharacterized protein n=1 Tax=Parathielavia appendiculata TaxID=2587402 RepID=A0AAN6YZV7_9PEZI|nr:hypothetical protein N657DRAFT_693505 [Parathielavia appendiculata]
MSQTHVLVIDTRMFPKGAFIKDMEAIETFYLYSGELRQVRRRRLSGKYFGEYLSQGRLDVSGQCHQASMQQLIDAGLFALCPRLDDKDRWERWALPVLDIRKEIKGASIPADKEAVRRAIAVAQTLLDGFRSMFGDEELAALDIANMEFDSESERMPEMKVYEDMMKAIHHCHAQAAVVRGVGDADGLADRSKGMKISTSAAHATVDIVFVHDLNGDREKTWTAHDTSEAWPRALLPSELPTARVLTFGYDAYAADWRGVVSQNRIGNHAWNLLLSLATY